MKVRFLYGTLIAIAFFQYDVLAMDREHQPGNPDVKGKIAYFQEGIDEQESQRAFKKVSKALQENLGALNPAQLQQIQALMALSTQPIPASTVNSERMTEYAKLMEDFNQHPEAYGLSVKVQSMEDAIAFRHALKQLKDLKRLKTLDLTLVPNDALKSLKSCLKKMDIYEISVASWTNNMPAVSKLIQKWPNLSRVKANNSAFHDDDAGILIKSLIGHQNLRFINFEANQLTVDLVPLFESLIITCPKLIGFQIRANSGIAEKGAHSIHKLISEQRPAQCSSTSYFCGDHADAHPGGFKTGGFIFAPKGDTTVYDTTTQQLDKTYSGWMHKPLHELIDLTGSETKL